MNVCFFSAASGACFCCSPKSSEGGLKGWRVRNICSRGRDGESSGLYEETGGGDGRRTGGGLASSSSDELPPNRDRSSLRCIRGVGWRDTEYSAVK